MGKIFEFADIANNRVPKPGDFAKVKTFVLTELSHLAEAGKIYGAKVFGSVAKGTPSERSDFDLVVITDRDKNTSPLQEMFKDIKDRTNIGIEPIVVDKEFAKKGLHSIDGLFLEHIRSVSNDDNVAGSNPLDILKAFDLSPTKIHEQYLVQKLRRLNEGVFSYSELDRNRVLQRALEAPVNTGRRMLQVLTYMGYDFKMHDDSKKAVIKHFGEVFGETSLQEGFNFLLQADQSYTTLLKESLQGLVSEEAYCTKINLLAQKCLPKAIDWVSEISFVHNKLLEGRAPYLERSNPHGNKERFI